MVIAWLFPGQGSQSVGMAKDVVEASAAARDVLARVDEALGESLSKLILEGPEEELTLTANTQPALAAAAKGRVIPLKVSAPFHCALMAPAARVVEDKLGSVAIAAPRFPIVANVDAKPNTDAARVKELLVRQVDGPVRWEESVRFMASSGVTRALEIGPGKVLAGIVKRIAKDIKVL